MAAALATSGVAAVAAQAELRDVETELAYAEHQLDGAEVGLDELHQKVNRLRSRRGEIRAHLRRLASSSGIVTRRAEGQMER